MNFNAWKLLTFCVLISSQLALAAGEPEVRFLQPAAGNSGPNLGVVVDASDADGKVREIKLYINNSLVRRERAAPYEWGTANTNSDDPLLLNLAPGTYQLRAVAKDNENKTATARRTITVLGSEPSIAAASVANGVDRLNTNDSLSPNQYLASSNGAYRLYLQGDGNIVLRDQATGSSLRSSRTQGQNGTRLVLQGDGNLVLYTDAGSAVWSSQTNGQGATRAVLQNDGNFVLYTSSNSPVWATGTAQADDGDSIGDDGSAGDDGSDNGGSGANDGGSTDDNDGTATSTGEFSAPSAALYSLNSNKQLGFPKHIDTGFGGNGHAETWDGRIFVRTRTDGWFASAFRPERIVRNNDGSVAFNQGAFGNSISLELRSEASDMQHNWIALMPDPAVSGENPYPSNSAGSYQLNGSHRTYKALVYHTSTRNGDNDQMGQRTATFIVSNANTRDAQLIRAEFTSSFRKLTLQNGADFRCIEPTATIDSRLVICQGHPDNNGRIDNLVYSWTSTPGATNNWRMPKSLANMYFDDRNSNVDGISFQERYPLAQKPILDATGNDYNRGELIKGAYPWVSHDGTELFYQASREGVSARRTGTSVVGRWTGWTIRHIDGPINRDRHRTSKLFLSSPGAFTTMWTPYKNMANLAIPYSLHGPVYPIFGSNTSDYSEVGFDDYLDGNYVMYLSMNEQLNRAGDYQRTRTNDTSGNFNNATLVGAEFPIEFNGQDQLVGRYGQAIHFGSGHYLNVTKNQAWDSLTDGVSVDMWVRKSSGSGRVRLFNLGNGVELNLLNGATLSASIHDTNSRLEQINGRAIANNSWTHVAFTYSPVNKEMVLYINGEEVARKQAAANFGTVRTSGAVRVGPQNSSAQLILDEVKVSNVARRAYEIAHNANVRTNKAPSNALVNQVPDHLRSLLDNATGVDRFSLEAAELGEALFSDTILSKQRTTSCATCHDASIAFTDGLDIAKGDEPTDAGTRNTPMLQNRLFSSLQGWSGISSTLDVQALTPVAAAHEMNLPIDEAVQRLRASSVYASLFQEVFGEAPNAENFPIALASFEAVQFSPKNRVDEFKEGNRSVLSASERRGLDLFENKARCSGCHAGANFTDESFRNNGLAMNDDIGRAEVTGRDRDHKLFKVPSLRELGLTGPYMHDGSIASLTEVVQAYNRGAVNVAERDSDMRPLELSSQEVNDIVNFLGALSENGASGGTGGSTNVSEVSRVNGLLVGGAGSSKPGYTLYVFDNDQGSSSSNCVGGCVNAWPPVLVADSGASGVSGLSTITRGDGTKQAAYLGRPLYFFASDSSPSDKNGEGVNGVWWIADDANANGEDNGGDSGGDSGGDTNVGGDNWTECANENGTCRFSGTRTVAYGANGIFVQKTFTGSASCNNSTFGDPTPGVPKQCWYLNDSAGDDTGAGSGAGSITRQVWTGVSGTGLSAMTSLATYPNSPNMTNEITRFEAQSNWADNYGTRIVGYLHAPVSGTYTFWIATDDNGELWLSTNDSEANKQKIAFINSWAGIRDWAKFSSQKSASITLQAGQRYFIEALQKEAGGGDNIAVAWQRPGGALEVIPGDYLSPYTNTTEPESNVALGKVTSQSSTAAGGLSQRAVDGNTSGVWGNASVTHTGGESQAWWSVDLAGAHAISKVTLWNRTDCCSSRLANFHVDALAANGSVIATRNIAGVAGEKTDISLPASGVHAVRVQLNGSNYLSLAEVQVYGSSDSSDNGGDNGGDTGGDNGGDTGGDNGGGTGGDNGGDTGDDNGGDTGDDNGGDTGGDTTTVNASFEKRISSSNDDAEEQSNGSVNTTSSDLELVFDNSNQRIGMRFTDVTIPQGATINRAYIQFTTDETNSGGTSLRVFGHDIDDAPAFSTSNNNISDRDTTNASSAWNPSAWNSVGAAGNDQRTNELKFIVQEIVNRGGWRSGNDMAFIVTGSGERTAESYDGSSSTSPLLRIEYTFETNNDSDNGGDDTGGDTTPSEISHVGSNSDYDGSGDVRLNVPSGTREGDLLMVYLSRTDDLLPIRWNGWTAGASCYKTDNGQQECHEIRHCSNPDGDYCLNFNGGNGRDLATVVFYKTASASEPSNYRFNMRNNHAGWGIITTLRGANTQDPIRSVATESNDNNPDSLFPSVNGNVGDLLMLSMAFDDTAARDDFGPPSGMQLFSWINGSDEAGYLYGEVLSATGPSGSRKTSGPGGPNAKDALIALTVKSGTSTGSTGGDDGGSGNDDSTGVGGDSEANNNWLRIGGDLSANQYMASENGRYRLYLQGDGNIVLRDQQTGAALWSTGTHGQNGTRLVFQSDGNFVLYTSSGSAVWASGTNGTGASRVVLNNDGSIAIYSGNSPIWAENGSGNTGTDDGTGDDNGGDNGGDTNGVKIAFIGDTGVGGNFQNVLNLIKSEGAELTVVAGDTSYSSSRDDDWDRMVRDTLGVSDPALVVAGNHDYGDSNFGDVRSYGQSRLNRQSAVQCSGAYAEKMTCNYKGIYFVMSAIGSSGSRSEHESFISNSLNNAPDGAWRVCAWHKNQRDMQVGGKGDETGWTAYETCRQNGAIIATGHEHSYSRTHLLSDMSDKRVASTASTMTLTEGRSLAFVSGLGGIGIRDQERGGDWWASIYTSSQGARYGAMFGTFYEDRAEFYFKNINGQIIDQFTVIKGY